MYTSNPSMSGVSLRGVAYPVKDQIAVVDDDFIAAMRSLGFITAAEAKIKAAEVAATSAAEATAPAAPPAKAEAPSATPAKAQEPAPAKAKA
jgi:hypothetical protein